ncbi:hypothetical protein M3Y96_00581600 [Aphelenchoides besseyi]|nr:hypothetical protein M3Y96_00581600 [Aphelenchoides besseyi]
MSITRIVIVVLIYGIFERTTAAEILAKYHCGVGTVTKVLSYASSSFCGRDKLNACCFSHDRCYDVNYMGEESVLRGCDQTFHACIRRSYGDGFCSKFLGFTHGTFVEQFGAFYRTVFGYDPMVELSHQEWPLDSKEDKPWPAVQTLDSDTNDVVESKVIRALRIRHDTTRNNKINETEPSVSSDMLESSGTDEGTEKHA